MLLKHLKQYYFQGKGSVFYSRPLDKGGIKFGEQAVGVNKLSSIMKTMCSEVGI